MTEGWFQVLTTFWYQNLLNKTGQKYLSQVINCLYNGIALAVSSACTTRERIYKLPAVVLPCQPLWGLPVCGSSIVSEMCNTFKNVNHLFLFIIHHPAVWLNQINTAPEWQHIYLVSFMFSLIFQLIPQGSRRKRKFREVCCLIPPYDRKTRPTRRIPPAIYPTLLFSWPIQINQSFWRKLSRSPRGCKSP